MKTASNKAYFPSVLHSLPFCTKSIHSMKNYLVILLALFLFGNISSAQNYLTLTGKVLDKKNNQPLAFAHVGIPERGIGTTTGHDGRFEFKVPHQYRQSTMTVSFMGYQTYEKPVHAFKNNSNIYIKQVSSDLVEVVVMGQNAIEDIIRKAVKNIPKNYPTHATTVLGFYRESRTDDSSQYVYLAEGVLNIYKNSYQNSKDGEVSLVQGRKINLKNPLDTSVYSGFSSGHLAGHRFDFVKNREDFIDESYFPVYKYWIESITHYNGRPVYIIGFDKDGKARSSGKKKKKRKSLLSLFKRGNKNMGKIEGRMKGKLYIEQGSYAFIRAEFEILPEGLKKYNDYPLYAGNWDGNKYVVNYRKVGDKWHFSDALREGEYGGGGLYSNEIKITEINTEKSSPIPYLQRMARGRQFVKMTGSYDEDFWKDYNTTPLNEGLAESVQQFKSVQKAQEVFDTEYMASLKQQRDSIQAAKMQEQMEQLAKESGKSIEDIEFMPEEFKRVQKARRRFDRVKFLLGTGAHVLSTEHRPLSISYLNGEGETIIAVNDDIPSREIEVILQWDFDVFFNRYFFMRFGNAFNFSNAIYKDWSMGVGTQLSLSKKRPVYFKTIAQYNYLRYARRVGTADNDYGKFKVKGKKFKANSISMNYGSRIHNVKLSAELAIELHPDRELYFRGSYFWTFADQQNVWFKERKEIFRADKRLPVKDDKLLITDMGMPFNGRIAPDQSLSFTVGLLFK